MPTLIRDLGLARLPKEGMLALGFLGAGVTPLHPPGVGVPPPPAAGVPPAAAAPVTPPVAAPVPAAAPPWLP